VPSTRYRLHKAIPTAASDDGFEDLQVAFHARLRSERVRFVTLSAALAGAEDDPACIFHDLSARAHKIHGGAAALDITDMAAAACALELAATTASASRADNTDAAVWSALVTLVKILGTLDSGDRALMAALTR
jgi:HPt (histidine-containing phosphotransfer) domain-containing protein